MTVTTGLFQIDPWMTGTGDRDSQAVGTAELGLDPAGAPWASLRLRMPSLDDPEWVGGRWLRVDLVERCLEYLVDLDGEVSREAVWPYDSVELADVRHLADDESLLHTFAGMVAAATELQVRTLTDEVVGLYGLDGTRWAPPARPE
ncbi:hypothetical protein I4I73_13060 [Pseudonocardia sp. KRD-184]|uniref:Immunity protein 8 of polymorphic toxin system n=1 Tax=Pseudonocardia oceani TaxID=2792013 RepID=A0ABS6U8G2_9PSEU|nr:hypothetical protein [Pseudonocardia oceani]MBW0092646.1 hypothetical protein [Pseudonocardia oceani]MBW0096916.1 hypothetical protein [Pseudonocardia oceani]MBW0123731.1 hypothetical protein [Pseudonocardia oceani]MBW0128492.1 hypothetical protein [Pseudonocardia oceani]